MKAVLFDLDETLYPDTDHVRASIAAASEIARDAYGVSPAAALRDAAVALWDSGPAAAYRDVMGLAWWEGLWSEFPGSSRELLELRAWAPRYRVEAWAGALAAVGVTDAALAGRLADAFIGERRTRHTPYDDAIPALDRLALRCSLAIITNGIEDLQREKLERSGLAGRFDPVVISCATGVGKPDPRIFRIALEAIGVTAADAVMVGDNVDRDVEGARRSGIRSVWIDRDARPLPPASTHPDVRITSLAQLDDHV